MSLSGRFHAINVDKNASRYPGGACLRCQWRFSLVAISKRIAQAFCRWRSCRERDLGVVDAYGSSNAILHEGRSQKRRLVKQQVRERVLVISPIGCGPPHSGNRTRIGTLLRELRNIGYEIHFAWAQIPDHEEWARLSPEARQETSKLVDHWVHDFLWPSKPIPRLSSLAARARHAITRITRGKQERNSKGIHRLDQWFHDDWIKQAKALQRRYQYNKIIVAYVFCTGFFRAFPSEALRVLDCHDIFTCRNDAVSNSEASNWWYAIYKTDERRALLRASHIIGIQEHETAYFRNLVNGMRPVFSIGHFTDVKPLEFTQAAFNTIGFIGSENPINSDGLHWFLGRAWPLILENQANSRLLIAGGVCRRLGPTPTECILMGEVDSVEDFYSCILLAINPVIVGTGLKIKTVEALSYGRAIVTSPAGFSGLDGYHGQGLELANTPEEFASAVASMLNDPQLAISKGAMASDVARELNSRSRDRLRMALNFPGEGFQPAPD